jgi:hypothetical protein
MVRHRKKQRGGYSSATTYGSWIAGSGDSQFSRVMDSASGSNQLTPVGSGANGVLGAPTSQQLSLIQSGGRHRRGHSKKSRGGRKSRRSKKGGFLEFGPVINQAIVPFGILGLQQTYKKRGSPKHKKTQRVKFFKK